MYEPEPSLEPEDYRDEWSPADNREDDAYDRAVQQDLDAGRDPSRQVC